MKAYAEHKKLMADLKSKGWMTHAEWRKFGKRQAGICVDEKVMQGIAKRWDENRLEGFPNTSKFEYTKEHLPPGHEHYIITTPEWKLIMGHFTSPIPTKKDANTNQWSFFMWRLENGKEYVDWCKGSDFRKV